MTQNQVNGYRFVVEEMYRDGEHVYCVYLPAFSPHTVSGFGYTVQGAVEDLKLMYDGFIAYWQHELKRELPAKDAE